MKKNNIDTKKRVCLKVMSAAWVTPVISTVGLPAHAESTITQRIKQDCSVCILTLRQPDLTDPGDYGFLELSLDGTLSVNAVTSGDIIVEIVFEVIHDDGQGAFNQTFIETYTPDADGKATITIGSLGLQDILPPSFQPGAYPITFIITSTATYDGVSDRDEHIGVLTVNANGVVSSDDTDSCAIGPF